MKQKESVRGAGYLLLLATLLSAVAAGDGAALADDTKFDIGVNASVVTAGGEPANDMIGISLYGRYRLSPRWLVGFGVAQAEYDFERPWKTLGLEQDPSVETIDTTATALSFNGWIEAEYGRPESSLRWFWSAGLGFTSPEVDDVTGGLAGGGTFDITTDAGNEFLLSVAGGVRCAFGRHWGGEFALRVDQHFADWEVQDRVSGLETTIDSYTGLGAHAGVFVRF